MAWFCLETSNDLVRVDFNARRRQTAVLQPTSMSKCLANPIMSLLSPIPEAVKFYPELFSYRGTVLGCSHRRI